MIILLVAMGLLYYGSTGHWIAYLLPAVQAGVNFFGPDGLTLLGVAIGLGYFMLATRHAGGNR